MHEAPRDPTSTDRLGWPHNPKVGIPNLVLRPLVSADSLELDRAPYGRQGMCLYRKGTALRRKTSGDESPCDKTVPDREVPKAGDPKICPRYVRNVGVTGSNPVTSTTTP